MFLKKTCYLMFESKLLLFLAYSEKQLTHIKCLVKMTMQYVNKILVTAYWMDFKMSDYKNNKKEIVLKLACEHQFSKY